MSELKAYFKDIYNTKPFCYERTIGKIKLPWNDEVIDIFACYGPITVYIPVVDGLYDDDIWFGEDKYNGFTEEDLNKYVERVKNKKRQDKIDNTSLNNLVQCAKRLDEISVPSCSITISRQTALQFQEDDNSRLVKLLKEVFPDLKETAEAGVYTSKYGGVSWLIKNRV